MDTDRILALADHLDRWPEFHDGPKAAADLRTLVAQRQAVLDMHRPYEGWCATCEGGEQSWPCPTVRALGVSDA